MVVESILRKLGLTHILDNKFHKRLRSDTLNTSSQKIVQTTHIGTNLSLIVDSANQLLCILVEAPRNQRGILPVDTVPLYMDPRLVPQSHRCTCSLRCQHFPSLNLNLPDMICRYYLYHCIRPARMHTYRLERSIRHNTCYSTLNMHYTQDTGLRFAHSMRSPSARHLDNKGVSTTATQYLHILWHLAVSIYLKHSLCTTDVPCHLSTCYCCKKHSVTKTFLVRRWVY
jgi:hypothetical protein